MSQQELLKKVIRALNDSGLQYLLTGSLVSSLQGAPRATHDIDVVVALTKDDRAKILKAFTAPDYYVDPDSINEAIENQSRFNIIDLHEGDKIDFWILTGSPFDKSRFAHRIQEDIFGCRIYVSRPEDTILMKLKWALDAGGSEKQFFDALRVYEIQYVTLDLKYLDDWALRLGIDTLWKRLKQEAATI